MKRAHLATGRAHVSQVVDKALTAIAPLLNVLAQTSVLKMWDKLDAAKQGADLSPGESPSWADRDIN